MSPLRLAPILLILAACAALLLRTIDLTNSDLGRHIENGEILWEGSHPDAAAVLRTNHYSFAAPDAPFVNHHWLSGVVFFLVFKAAGFEGLTVFYAVLVALTSILSYWTAQRVSNPVVAAALATLALPLLAFRDQVRPEAFTYLFTALFYLVLLAWARGWAGNRSLILLPCLMVLWINLHIEFVFGFALLGAFALAAVGRIGGQPTVEMVWRSLGGLHRGGA